MPGEKEGGSVKKSGDSFESKLEKLEELVAKLESDEIPLEEAINLYERGMTIHKECEKILSDARLRIEKLSTPGEA